tara:strand:- start:574 stop:810 length:237 start_codon:yes stop_codon:yes gene_type:complete
MPQSKTITIEENEEEGTVVTVEQTMIQDPPEESLEIGGIRLNTDLPWYADASILLVLIALIYIAKKNIDKWFDKKKKK